MTTGSATTRRAPWRPALVEPARYVRTLPGEDPGTGADPGSRAATDVGAGGASGGAGAGTPRGGVSAGAGAGAGVGAGEDPAVGLINVDDLDLDGCGPGLSVIECLELIERLEAGVLDGRGAEMVAVLRCRVANHTAALADQATTRAVEVIAAEQAAARGAGPAARGEAVWEREIRAAATMVAAHLSLTPTQVRACIGNAEVMDQVPLVAAAALQGLIGPDKVGLVAHTWAAIPPGLRVEAVAGQVVQTVLDQPLPGARRDFKAMLAMITAQMDSATLEARVRRHARVRVFDLGGGLAELSVVDRAENIQTIATVAEAGARAARHAGAKEPLGLLRAGVIANMARQGLRDQQVPTAFGTPLPLERQGGAPVRLHMLQTPIRSLLPPGPGMANVQWALRDAGILTRVQADSLRDDPIWGGIVEQISLIDQRDPDYLAACEVISPLHDGTPTQRRWVARRDGFHCRCPWCTDSSPPTDLHHTVAFATTGTTTVRDLIYLHGACHDILHHGWEVEMDDDGTAHFTDPHGHTYTTTPNGLTN